MSCPHAETNDFDKVEVQGHLLTLTQCQDCKQVGFRRDGGYIDWSGDAPLCRHCGLRPLQCAAAKTHDYEPDLRVPNSGDLRQRDFELALQRLKDVELFFGLIAERWDIQTAVLIESILRNVRDLARGDFNWLVTVATMSEMGAQRAKHDNSQEIITHLVEQLGGEVTIPSKALEPNNATTLLHFDNDENVRLKVAKRPSSIR